MKILIFGAGVIGTVYAWQLSNAGHNVTLLVREEKKQIIEDNGIRIRCSDYRKGEIKLKNIVYKPSVTDDLSQDDAYDLIIVSVKTNQLDTVLQQINSKVANSDVLIFQSFWYDADKIEKYLLPSQYIFGFPHIMGGGRDEEGIYCSIFGNKNAPTMIGEKDGQITPRIRKIEEVMNQANLNPQISTQILPWILTHYAEAAGLLGGVMKAGSGRIFAESSKIMTHTLLAIREGLNVCKARGIKVNNIRPQNLYYLPIFILIPFFKRMYSSDGAQLMIKGHISHSKDEMKSMFYDVLETGKKHNVNMKYFSKLSQYVDKFTTLK